MDNNLLTQHNSGFKKNDSTVNQLLKIIHQIYQDVNDGNDTCLVFLDVSKAFDKVWHMRGYCLRSNKWVLPALYLTGFKAISLSVIRKLC